MRVLTSLAAVLAVGCQWAVPAMCAPAPPRFSWDKVSDMVFYHSCNYTGPYSEEALRTVAKFPFVTIEKGQQVFDGAPYAEDVIVETLRRVKKLNPNISTIFYYNSVLDWPFYRLHEEFMQHPEWAFPSGKGDNKPCRMDGDRTFPNHTNMLVFDLSQQVVQDFWASECLNMTKTGFVDGCFSDRAAPDSLPACPFTSDAQKEAYLAGHLKVHQDLQKALGSGVLVANHAYNMSGVGAAMIESFAADEASIQLLNDTAALGKIVEAHAGYHADGSDNHCSDGVENSLAAFLIGARENSFYGCSSHWDVGDDPISGVWHPEYDRPLGAPQGFATKTGDLWTRQFASGTVVTFNATSNVGKIQWATTEGFQH